MTPFFCSLRHLALTSLICKQHGKHGKPVSISIGLHKWCDSVAGSCRDFPEYEDCHGDSWAFCSRWRTVGFLMSFAVVIELAALIGYAVVLLGGKQKRDVGWKMISGLLIVGGAVSCVAMAIVVRAVFVGTTQLKLWGDVRATLTGVLGLPLRSR